MNLKTSKWSKNVITVIGVNLVSKNSRLVVVITSKPLSVSSNRKCSPAQRQAGRFVLATNQLDKESLSDEQLLIHYKQQQGIERGFRFLKDPLFFASSVFLKTPERIMALTFIMALSFAKTLTMPYDDLKI